MSKNWYLCNQAGGECILAGKSSYDEDEPIVVYVGEEDVVNFIRTNSPIIWLDEESIDIDGFWSVKDCD